MPRDRSVQSARPSLLRLPDLVKGDWHSTLVYLDRVPIKTIGYGEPEALSVRHEHVLEAAREVGVSFPAE